MEVLTPEEIERLKHLANSTTSHRLCELLAKSGGRSILHPDNPKCRILFTGTKAAK